MSVLDQANPKVKAFIEACEARVMSLNEFDDYIGGMSQRGRGVAIQNAGFYNVAHDIIVINTDTPNAISILDRTLLHELGHWSGRSNRMQRKVIVNTEKNLPYTQSDLDNEEIIAELIAFQLGSEIGIMTKEWQAKSENYIGSFRNGSVYGARDHVKQATWFLIKIATPTLRAG
jgi:antirestriction protein ArdC